MPAAKVHNAPNGLAYLNAGCGGVFSPDWNNVDRRGGPHVVPHDLRKPLPFPGAAFDAVYSSHLLEHLEPEDGDRFLRELFRTVKPGGVCRIVVPDYEQACREYLRCLEDAIGDPGPRATLRYRWAVLEMIDQFTRRKPGGRMLRALESGDFDEEYVRRRNGGEFSLYYSGGGRGRARPLSLRIREGLGRPWKELPSFLAAALAGRVDTLRGDAGRTGELHRWAYDRFGLKAAMEGAGFVAVGRKSHDASGIPDWQAYALDTEDGGSGARKPDSLYMEGIRPLPGCGAAR